MLDLAGMDRSWTKKLNLHYIDLSPNKHSKREINPHGMLHAVVAVGVVTV